MTNYADQPVLLSIYAALLFCVGIGLTRVKTPGRQVSERERTDNAIAEIVLTDMVTRDSDELGFSFSPSQSRIVYYSRTPPDHVGEVTRALEREEIVAARFAQHPAVIEAIQNLDRRHAAGDGLPMFLPRNSRLRLAREYDKSAVVIYPPWLIDLMISDVGQRLHEYWIRSPFSRPYQSSFPVELTAPG